MQSNIGVGYLGGNQAAGEYIALQGVNDRNAQLLALFEIRSSGCTVNADGRCFLSPNYPSDYPDNVGCHAKVRKPGFVMPETFGSEWGYDFLTFRNPGH